MAVVLPVLVALLSGLPYPGHFSNGDHARGVGLDVRLATDHVEVEEVYLHELENAAEFRLKVDQAVGDADGAVTTEELASFTKTYERSNSTDPMCLGAMSWLLLDGRSPVHLERAWTTLEGAEGPVISHEEVVERHHYRFRYDGSSNASEASVDVRGWFETQLVDDCRGAGPGMALVASGYGWAIGDWALVLRIGTPDGFTLDRDSLRPQTLDLLWENGALVADRHEERNRLFENVVSVRVFSGPAASQDPAHAESARRAASSPPSLLWLLPLAPLTAAWRLESVRWAVLRWTVAGFSRMERGEALLHRRRHELLALIEAEPGACLADLQRATGLAHGSLVHHLRILEAKGFIRPERDGHRARFFPRGPASPTRPYVTGQQRRLLDLVAGRPGVNQTEILEHIGGPRDQLSYHLRRLEGLHLIRSERAGRWRRYYPQAPFETSG